MKRLQTTPISVIRSLGTSSCAALLRDVSRRITHQVNNAANGVAVNLEVVRSRAGRADAVTAIGPFAERASEQLEELTALQEVIQSLLQLAIDAVDEDRLNCRLSPSGDAIEITFTGAVLPHGLRAECAGVTAVTMRNSPRGVILSVPRHSPGSE